MNTLTRRGGARIGGVNASWPLASLFVSVTEMMLKVVFIGTYKFHPEQVVSIEKHTIIPFFAWGVKVNHVVSSYPEKMIFWTLSNPQSLILKIEEIGFLASASEDKKLAAKKVQKNGFPVKVLPLALVIIFWNLLILFDMSSHVMSGNPPVPDKFSLLALVLVFALSVLIKFNTRVASLFLKPNRSIGEIMPYINLFMLVSGLMTLMLSVLLMSGIASHIR